MTNAAVERLIEYVKQHPCLYDSSHKEYKNVATKNEIWEAIGRELDTTGDFVKNKWKTLRDGFTKNKKQLKEKTLMKTYTWAPQLAFLENYLQKQTTIDLTPSSPVTIDFDPFASIDNNETSSDKELPVEDTVPIDKTSTIPRRKSTKRKISEDEDDITRIIDFLSKKKNKDDAISHLFLSYAETFRKFPVNEQITLKVQLAKLFSHAELKFVSNVDKNKFILPTNEEDLLQTEDEEMNQQRRVKTETEDAQYCTNEEPLENIHDQRTEMKSEPREIEDNDHLLSKQLRDKADELKKANEQLFSLNEELERLKTRNFALETRNANLEAAMADLKMRLNNLV
ncbi:uncharacterized protein LOC128678655 isoform X2 [Plodia interpunctella]|uniref:uncharacterized protein LOC128678655 isoform X2 n=1 Tax=Plodia interpunctella TaxID=58824 RepID=UPI002367512A|nr:uncharacterized protein LOC128678655 isoform X2 [Plodia interpunctella]XP_053616345.1 uncharacterized protein LOC128678655 isoform X2 [Plodia interpunctella]XP_053616353.1 uncharacterized protein LOC128678655 isoform X2 [Plodia interpunctella]XP_053616362.1 uncharacterized protein LOC128678655 isoform X2 [Plodia interpunctella]XP_053616367.1 uncharacterized protein LOC128678655 isoform X2 [Plodia interpunctella]XP_053616375.1 uncharacterized protein LOC128678655 isoform X2 [Plodia interpunc